MKGFQGSRCGMGQQSCDSLWLARCLSTPPPAHATSNSGSCAQGGRIAFRQGSAVKNTSSLRSEQQIGVTSAVCRFCARAGVVQFLGQCLPVFGGDARLSARAMASPSMT